MASASDKFVNPEDQSFFTESNANPRISFGQLAVEVKSLYELLNSKYKFILASNQRRLRVTLDLKPGVKSDVITAYFAEPLTDPVSLSSARKGKIIRATVEMEVYSFIPLEIDESEDVKIKLRTRTDVPLIDELIALAREKGVEIVRLATDSATGASGHDASSGSFGSDDSKRSSFADIAEQVERQAKEAAERKAREEQAEADRKPLDYVVPVLDQQEIGNKGRIILGDLNEEDLEDEQTVQDEHNVSRSTATEILPAKKTEDEWNALGADMFEKSQIHKQKIAFADKLHEHYSLLVESKDGKLRQRHFAITDTRELCTTNGSYADIDRLKRICVIFYPPSHPSDGLVRIQNKKGEIRELRSPDHFRFVVSFSPQPYDLVSADASKSFLLHKFSIVSDETGSNRSFMHDIERDFKRDIDRIIDDLNTSRKYSSGGSASRTTGSVPPSASGRLVAPGPVRVPIPVTTVAPGSTVTPVTGQRFTPLVRNAPIATTLAPGERLF